MPIFNTQLDDEVLVDTSVPIAGVNNSLPPSAIDKTFAADEVNRLSLRDGLNRPRPGITRLQHPASSLDSINHLGDGNFLISYGGSWYVYNNRVNSLISASGGPAYAIGSQVYAALVNATLYFSIGATLNKFTNATGAFGTVTLPANGPTASYPIWSGNRLIYAYKNTLIVSDILNPEYFDLVTGSLTLDPLASDLITGMSAWQDQDIVVFRNGSTWVVTTGPNLDVPNWSLSRISATVGCRCHGTIVQAESDVFFLSETGRGVYRVSQAPASEQQGVWLPISDDIQGYINRINWVACDNARATYWTDLYILSVPLDNSAYNNFCLVYCVSMDRWQGIWCFEVNGLDIGVRDFARDRTDPNATALLIITRDGTISRFSYPMDRQYYDQNIDLTYQYYHSSLLTRAFDFGTPNMVRPHSVALQFLQSEDQVNVTMIADRETELVKKNVPTNNYLLSLTIPGLPFDLDREGYRQVALSLLAVGICSELQFQFEGSGNWTLYKIMTDAFESMPEIAT